MATLRIRQVRSQIGARQNQRATLRSLGLKKIGQQVERQDSDVLRGMIRSVDHLISFELLADRTPAQDPGSRPPKAAPGKKAAKKPAAGRVRTSKKTAVAAGKATAGSRKGSSPARKKAGASRSKPRKSGREK